MNACMNVCLLSLYDNCSCMHVLVQSILFQHFCILCMHMFMGLVARMVNAMVASFSLVGGSGTLQKVLKKLGNLSHDGLGSKQQGGLEYGEG